jgi:hypothetical protein
MSAEAVDPSVAPSLVDDVSLRLQRQIGLVPEWGLGVVRRAVFFALLTWLPLVARLALLFVLLGRIARLDLSIVPTHPDGAGGLGFVKDMPKAFSLLAFATSAVVASRLATMSCTTASPCCR